MCTVHKYISSKCHWKIVENCLKLAVDILLVCLLHHEHYKYHLFLLYLLFMVYSMLGVYTLEVLAKNSI